jgi:transcriptional regulator with XRE-family HTH domain
LISGAKLRHLPERKPRGDTGALDEQPDTIDPVKLGTYLRSERLRRGLGLRELARRVAVSPSFISQIERGLATPSVVTLYAIVQQLGLSLDGLFAGTSPAPATNGDRRAPAPARNIVRAGMRHSIQLGSGVRWELLTERPEAGVDFLLAEYDVGAASAEAGQMIRHAGTEYGYVLTGRLGVAIGFESYELGPGDSISFESTMPHRLWTIGDEPVRAVWIVLGRDGDSRAPAP